MLFLRLRINNFLCLYADGQKVKQSEHVKLLGVQTDSKLHVDEHVEELVRK